MAGRTLRILLDIVSDAFPTKCLLRGHRKKFKHARLSQIWREGLGRSCLAEKRGMRDSPRTGSQAAVDPPVVPSWGENRRSEFFLRLKLSFCRGDVLARL